MKVLLLLITILPCQLFAASADSVLAEVGDKKITTGEFRLRFEMSPQVHSQVDLHTKKEFFLYTLIAEKLFALEAERNNADTSEIMKYTYNEIERMYLRDALYKIEITDRIFITDDELKTAAEREMYKLVLRTFYSEDSSKAYGMYKYFINSKIPDTTAAGFAVDEIEITYGDLSNDIENAVYNLNKGEYTSPIKYAGGYYIFQLKEKKFSSEDNNDPASLLRKAEKKLREIKSAYRYSEYFNNFFAGRSVEADGAIFWSIAYKIGEKLKSKPAVKEGYRLTIDDIRDIENQFGDSLSVVYIKTDRSPLTIKEFLRKLSFKGFAVKGTDENTIAGTLNGIVKEIIESELLTAEAYRRGLHKLPGVKEEIRMWKDYNLSTFTTLQISDALSFDDINLREEYVSLREIITDDLTDIETILDEINNNKDFNDIADAYYKSRGLPAGRGYYELAPASSYGELGKTALTLKEGDIYGPSPVQGGYSIFKVLLKQKGDPAKLPDTKQSAEFSRFAANFEAVKNTAVKLAQKYGVKINYGLLNNVTVSDHYMLAFRMMGFGGRITAVPLVSPFYEWYELWQNSLKEVP
jgi:parvulin-like peptidyl-prolyl isomerase